MINVKKKNVGCVKIVVNYLKVMIGYDYILIGKRGEREMHRWK